MRGDFSNGPGRAGKREMSFPTAEQGYQKRKRNNIASQPGKTKQRGSFQTDAADDNLIMNVIQSTINVNVPMKCDFQFSLQDYKQKSFDFWKTNWLSQA